MVLFYSKTTEHLVKTTVKLMRSGQITQHEVHVNRLNVSYIHLYIQIPGAGFQQPTVSSRLRVNQLPEKQHSVPWIPTSPHSPPPQRWVCYLFSNDTFALKKK